MDYHLHRPGLAERLRARRVERRLRLDRFGRPAHHSQRRDALEAWAFRVLSGALALGAVLLAVSS